MTFKSIVAGISIAMLLLAPCDMEAKRGSGNRGKARTTKTSKSRKKSSGGTVYICTGPESTKYHRSANCRGLNRCSASIVKTSPKASGRKPCRICYH